MVLSSHSGTHFQTTSQRPSNRDCPAFVFHVLTIQPGSGLWMPQIVVQGEDECGSRDVDIRHAGDDQMRNVSIIAHPQ